MAGNRLFTMAVFGAALAMAGCAATGEDVADADQCGAEALQDRIGEPVTGTTAEDLLVSGEPVTGANFVRVVEEGQPMTMDYRPDRLTIEVDESGNLVSARCV